MNHLRILRLVSTAALLAAASPARLLAAEADSAGTAAPQLVHPTLRTEVRRPSPGVAALLSHGAMILPIVASTQFRDEHGATRAMKQSVAVAAGVVIGPATGYWYGDVAARGNRGMVGRLVCAGVFFGTWAAADDFGGDFNIAALGLFGTMCASAGVAGVWAIWDAAAVAPAVEKHNREVRAVSWEFGTRVTPASHAPAIAVTTRF